MKGSESDLSSTRWMWTERAFTVGHTAKYQRVASASWGWVRISGAGSDFAGQYTHQDLGGKCSSLEGILLALYTRVVPTDVQSSVEAVINTQSTQDQLKSFGS